jgi:hypothetical protein
MNYKIALLVALGCISNGLGGVAYKSLRTAQEKLYDAAKKDPNNDAGILRTEFWSSVETSKKFGNSEEQGKKMASDRLKKLKIADDVIDDLNKGEAVKKLEGKVKGFEEKVEGLEYKIARLNFMKKDLENTQALRKKQIKSLKGGLQYHKGLISNMQKDLSLSKEDGEKYKNIIQNMNDKNNSFEEANENLTIKLNKLIEAKDISEQEKIEEIKALKEQQQVLTNELLLSIQKKKELEEELLLKMTDDEKIEFEKKKKEKEEELKKIEEEKKNQEEELLKKIEEEKKKL